MNELPPVMDEPPADTQDTLVSLAREFASEGSGEVGLLYWRLHNAWARDRSVPSKPLARTIARRLAIDLERKRTHVRTRAGKTTGTGVGVWMLGEDSIDLPIAEKPPQPGPEALWDVYRMQLLGALTSRQRMVVERRLLGMSNVQIAADLKMSEANASRLGTTALEVMRSEAALIDRREREGAAAERLVRTADYLRKVAHLLGLTTAELCRAAHQGKISSEMIVPKRERQVACLTAAGGNTKEIAVALGMTARTVRRHRNRFRQRIGKSDLAGLTRYVLAKGWIENEFDTPPAP